MSASSGGGENVELVNLLVSYGCNPDVARAAGQLFGSWEEVRRGAAFAGSPRSTGPLRGLRPAGAAVPRGTPPGASGPIQGGARLAHP